MQYKLFKRNSTGKKRTKQKKHKQTKKPHQTPPHNTVYHGLVHTVCSYARGQHSFVSIRLFW